MSFDIFYVTLDLEHIYMWRKPQTTRCTVTTFRTVLWDVTATYRRFVDVTHMWWQLSSRFMTTFIFVHICVSTHFYVTLDLEFWHNVLSTTVLGLSTVLWDDEVVHHVQQPTFTHMWWQLSSKFISHVYISCDTTCHESPLRLSQNWTSCTHFQSYMSHMSFDTFHDTLDLDVHKCDEVGTNVQHPQIVDM